MRKRLGTILNKRGYFICKELKPFLNKNEYIWKNEVSMIHFYRHVTTTGSRSQEANQKENKEMSTEMSKKMGTEMGTEMNKEMIKEMNKKNGNDDEETSSLGYLNINQQKDFLKNFQEEEHKKTEEYTTVKILKRDEVNKEFILNNEKYINFLKLYNEGKRKNQLLAEENKKNRFNTQHIPLIEQEEKSLWQILKEKEDELKNKKKLKSYQKELNNKMKRESEKIKKEEKYANEYMSTYVDLNMMDSYKNRKNDKWNTTMKNKEEKKMTGEKKKTDRIKVTQEEESKNTYNDSEDIDFFLQKNKNYVADIKSYDEIYQGTLKQEQNISEKNNEKVTVVHDTTNVNERANFIEKEKKEKNEKKEKKEKKEEEESYKDISVDQLVYEDFKTNVTNSGTKMYKQYTSNLLNNDMDSKEKWVFEKTEEFLFSKETDNTPIKKYTDIQERFDKLKKKNIKECITEQEEIHDNKNVIEVKPSDIIKRLSGEHIETIVNSNIDNLIIQKEIKRENTAHGIINIMYNNLNNCDHINLSTGMLKISKVVDIYQKQSITKNHMFLCIIKKLEENLSLLNVSNLVQIFYAFVKLQHLPFFFNHIINRIIENIQNVEPKQMCSILYTLSNIVIETHESKHLKNEVIQLVKKNMHQFVALKDIICLLTSLSKLKFKEVMVYYELSKKIEEQIDQLTMKHISNILWAFSNVNYTCKLVKRVKKIIEKNIHEANYLDIVNIIYSLTKLNEYDDFHLYNDVFFNAINIYIHNMSVKNLCIILWCYTYAGIDKPELYINILTKINEHMKYVTCKDVVSILTCLSKIKYNYKFAHLYNHLKNKVTKNIYAFTPLQLTNVMYHSSFLDIKDHKYYFLLIQQIYQIKKLLYLENWTLILYAMKNVCYLNVQHLQVFQLIVYILKQIKKKYKLLPGEDCVNIILILNELERYTYQGYFAFNHLSSYYFSDSPSYLKDNKLKHTLEQTTEFTKETYNSSLTLDLFSDDIKLNELSLSNDHEQTIYFPHLYNILYEQIKIRLNNYWKLNIKDVNNLLLIMKHCNIFDNTVINMILRQIVPVLMKCTNIEFLIFLSNVSADKSFQFLVLTHLARRPKLISVFRSKVNSITQHITRSFERVQDHTNGIVNDSELSEEEKDFVQITSVMEGRKYLQSVKEAKIEKENEWQTKATGEIENETKATVEIEKKNDISNSVLIKNSLKPVNRIDINSCISLAYACFNIHYEDENILNLYDMIEHMIIEENKKISTFMLINFLYILTVTNNKINFVKNMTEEYMNFRYGSNIEQIKQKKRNELKNEQSDDKLTENLTENLTDKATEKRKIKGNRLNENEMTRYNNYYDYIYAFVQKGDKFSNYAEKGDEEMSLIFLKLSYINILLNNYNYIYHLLSEVCKYEDDMYSDEFVNLAKQVCYHLFNFTNLFCNSRKVEPTLNVSVTSMTSVESNSDVVSKSKSDFQSESHFDTNFNTNFNTHFNTQSECGESFHLWHKISEYIYVTEDAIFLDLPFEKSNINLINEKESTLINPLLKNEKITKNLENNRNIAKFFYHFLNYNEENVHRKNWNTCATRKEKRSIKMFHFENVILDILNFLKIEYRGSFVYDNMYRICCSFPYERHLIDLISYEDVLFPSNKPLLSSELRQKHLALKGWTVHSLHFRDLYNSIKDRNIICYIFNICKKIKKDLSNLEDKEKLLNEKEFWENIEYANII